MILQKVYVPDRALFYKTIYLYLVASFLFFWVLYKMRIEQKYKSFLVGIILLMYCCYQLYHLKKFLAPVRVEEQQRKETFIWLKAFKPKNILVLDPLYALFLNHYFKAAKINCSVHSEIIADTQYNFLIFSVNDKLEINKMSLAPLGKKVYQNNYIRVYELEN